MGTPSAGPRRNGPYLPVGSPRSPFAYSKNRLNRKAPATYESVRVRPMSIAPWARTVWPTKSGGSVQAELLPGVLAHHTSYNAPFDSGLGQRLDGVPGAGCVVMRIP